VRPPRAAILAVLILVLAIAVLVARSRSPRSAPPLDAAPRTAADALLDPRFRIAGVHFWQGNWNYNFWSNLRTSRVRDDLRRIRSLGFNTIVLTVPWGTFQTDAYPPRYDGEAFDRLSLVLDEAWKEHLYVVLRVGTLEHIPRGIDGETFSAPYVFFDERELHAYADLFRETAKHLSRHPNLLFLFFSWEDLTAFLRIGQLGEGERVAYARRAPDWGRHLATRPLESWNREWGTSYESYEAIGIPPYGKIGFEEFLRFADDHLLNVVLPMIATAARSGSPDVRLSYEVRIDGEPITVDGKTRYVGHEITWPLRAGYPVTTAYFNPYWGAPNQGDTISPDDALRNFSTLLGRLHRATHDKPIFFDQLNFVDSTPAFRHNSRLAGEPEIADFLRRALPLIQQQSLGYALWSLDAYEGNVLENSRFERGTASWQSSASAEPTDGVAIRTDPLTRDHYVSLAPGASIAQSVRAGWNPGTATPDVPYTLRVRARSAAGGALEIRYQRPGALGAEPTTPTTIAPHAEWGAFQVQVPFSPECRVVFASTGSAPVDLDDVSLFNHVQESALFDPEGRPLGRRAEVVASANRRWSGAGDARGRSIAAAASPVAAPPGTTDDGWLLADARIPLSIPASAKAIELDLYLPETPEWRGGNGFDASIEHGSLGSFDVPPGESRVVLPLDGSDVPRGDQILRLRFRRTVVPAEHDEHSADARPLASMLRSVRVTASAPAGKN
jgi:hypothetical protein